jgi:hypothetical protein
VGENAASEVALEFGDDEAGQACGVAPLLDLRDRAADR